ncbi:MAG: zinc metalloprotease HtpX [Alphaproteobacteria bacterium]
MTARAIMVHRARHLVQTTALLIAMAVMVAAMGWAVAGLGGLIWITIIGSTILIVGPGLSARMMLKLYGAIPVPPEAAGELHALSRQLSQRAHLPALPSLFWVDDPGVLAITLGRPDRAYVMLSAGLLRVLTVRELAAVLAHEFAHIQHRDLQLMMVGEILIRLARAIAFAGIAMLLVNIPLYAFGRDHLSWMLPVFLLFAPSLIGLLQLGLSRSREYDADVGAIAITGDTAGLAAALRKLERYDISLLERILMPATRRRMPALLRSHPAIAERIQRLDFMEPGAEALLMPDAPATGLFRPPVRRQPRPWWVP